MMVISWWALGAVVVLWLVGDYRSSKTIRILQQELESKGYELDNMTLSRDSYRAEARRADKGLEHLEDLTQQAWTDAAPGDESQKAFDLYQKVVDVRMFTRDEDRDPNNTPW